MEEAESQVHSSEIADHGKRHLVCDEDVLQFLDSTDDYLTRMDSLSTVLRQGWLELASARHSMGVSRVNGAVLDLKTRSASTSLRVTGVEDDSEAKKAHFTLCKWASSESSPGEAKFGDEKLTEGQQIRRRMTTQSPEETATNSGATLTVDDQAQKERLKSLSVFGTLVSPKLRTSQLSFEKALEKIVEIANARSTMLAAFNRVKEGLESTDG